MQRDALLGHVAEKNLGGTTPERGEHNDGRAWLRCAPRRRFAD
jgi:hypothetical protein